MDSEAGVQVFSHHLTGQGNLEADPAGLDREAGQGLHEVSDPGQEALPTTGAPPPSQSRQRFHGCPSKSGLACLLLCRAATLTTLRLSCYYALIGNAKEIAHQCKRIILINTQWPIPGGGSWLACLGFAHKPPELLKRHHPSSLQCQSPGERETLPGPVESWTPALLALQPQSVSSSARSRALDT